MMASRLRSVTLFTAPPDQFDPSRPENLRVQQLFDPLTLQTFFINIASDMLRANALQTCLSLRHALARRASTVIPAARRRYQAPASPGEARADGVIRRKQSPYKSLCKLTLIGRTGAVPETRNFDDGSSVLCISVATTHASASSTDGNNETQWHNVFVSHSTPGFSFFEQLPVGSQLYVEGLLRIRTVERDGEKRQFVNVNVSQGFGMVRVLSMPRGAEMDAEDALQHKKLPF